MISAIEITKRLFIYGVLAFAVLPRHHIDRDVWEIGGDLCHSFRKLLLAIGAVNAGRLFFTSTNRSPMEEFLCDALGIFEVVALTFLSFLTPYILQKWLHESGRINIGGRPGESLMLPLKIVAVLSVSGVALSFFVHPNLFCLKKFANVVSAPPVLRTLKMYNTVTSVGGHLNGRGSIMAQTLVLVELWFFATQTLCTIGYAFNDRSIKEGDYTQWDNFLKAFRDISFVSDWTRVCTHAIFINLLDELWLTDHHAASRQNSREDDGDFETPDHGDGNNREDAASLVPHGHLVVNNRKS